MSVGVSSKLVKMEQPRVSDSVIETTIEYCHNERVLWDVNSTNLVKLEVTGSVCRLICKINIHCHFITRARATRTTLLRHS